MSNVYETQHGVKFGDNHSFRDFGMYPKTKMIVAPPKVREVYVEVAGADGNLDLTEALVGRPNLDRREAKFEFTVMNRERWDSVYTSLMNTIHGRDMRVVLDDDPYWYYSGRVQVDAFATSKHTATITVTGYFDPYKRSLVGNSLQWLWDTFNFETDVARDYAELVVDGTLTTTIVGSKMPVTPVIEVSSAMTLLFNGTTYSLSEGRNRIAGMTLVDDEYEMTFTGDGTVSVEFEIGSL